MVKTEDYPIVSMARRYGRVVNGNCDPESEEKHLLTIDRGFRGISLVSNFLESLSVTTVLRCIQK